MDVAHAVIFQVYTMIIPLLRIPDGGQTVMIILQSQRAAAAAAIEAAPAAASATSIIRPNGDSDSAISKLRSTQDDIPM